MLDYRLHTFMNLYQTMNYTRTAKNLDITQPAVTQHIKYLEATYKVKLFHYAKKKLTITKEGEFLYRSIAALQANSLKIMADITCLDKAVVTVKLGTSSTIAKYWMPMILKQLHEKDLGYDVELSVNMTDTLVKQLRAGDLDLAFVEGNFNNAAISSLPISKEELVLAVPQGHPLANKTAVTLNDMLNYRLLHGGDGDTCGAIFNQALQSANLTLYNFASHMIINDGEVIKQMVKDGIGIGIVYQSAIKAEVANHELTALKIKNAKMMREFNMVYLHETIFEEQFKAFYQFCIDMIKAI